jgi:hypothetical protein
MAPIRDQHLLQNPPLRTHDAESSIRTFIGENFIRCHEKLTWPGSILERGVRQTRCWYPDGLGRRNSRMIFCAITLSEIQNHSVLQTHDKTPFSKSGEGGWE